MNNHTFINLNRQEARNIQWFPMPRKMHRPNHPFKLLPGKNQQYSDQRLRASAQRKAKQGDYTNSIALLTQLICRHPNRAVDYNNRGLIYFQSGQPEKALADYNKALQLNPQLDSVYNNRANYYVSVGKLSEALADYEQALDLNPGNFRTWINQAITFRELGLYNLALENFDMALILGCPEEHIYAERGRTYHLRGDWNCAICDYQKALQGLSPFDSASSLYTKVEAWINQLLKPLSA
ncbi:MAG: tetratricopeptide repeat protein [Symploca sp. SIO2E6]|nr:tetratricopeptide repeat protein [Symploca sp. SIO2E6]